MPRATCSVCKCRGMLGDRIMDYPTGQMCFPCKENGRLEIRISQLEADLAGSLMARKELGKMYADSERRLNEALNGG